MSDIVGLLYRGIVALHPADFRKNFGPEMVLDFEEAKAAGEHAPLLADALVSLGRQWTVRRFIPAGEARFAAHAGLLSGQYIVIGKEGLSTLEWLRGLTAATAFLGLCVFSLNSTGHRGLSAMQADMFRESKHANASGQAGSHSRSSSEEAEASSMTRREMSSDRPREHDLLEPAFFKPMPPRWNDDAAPGENTDEAKGHNPSSGRYAEQPQEKPRAFEVVSIRPSGPDSKFMMNFTPDGFVAKDMYLQPVIVNAYHLLDQQLITAGKPIPGGPAWINSDRFDIEAKMSEADIEALKDLSVDEQLSIKREMLRTMLAARFNLKTHPTVGQQACFALTVGNKGSRLTASKAGETPHAFGRPGFFEARHSPVPQLAFVLTGALHCPVADETKLTGDYDYKLEYFPEPGPRMAPQAEPANPSDNAAPSIFTAVQEQLGLKLVPRTVPVSSIVIDHVEKPSAN